MSGLDDGGVILRREHPLRPARDQQGRRRARRARRELAALAGTVRRVRLRRVRSRAPQAGLGLRRRAAAPAYAGGAGAGRGRGAAAAHRDAGAAVHGRARRLEGLRQARGDRRAAAARSTRCSSAAGCASRSWPRRATASASRCWRPTRSARCRTLLESGKIVLPSDVVVADAFSADAARETVDDRRDPGRLAGPGHRARSRSRRSPGCSPTPRPSSGTARWACSSWRPFAEGTRGVAQAIIDATAGTARSASSAAATRPPPSARWAWPRTGSHTSRPAAARRWSSWRAKTSPAWRFWSPEWTAIGGRKPLIAGNWKMNLTHLEAIALMQKFAFALPEKYYDKVEVAVAAAVHAHPQHPDHDRRRRPADGARRAGPLPARLGRLHRRRVRRDAGKLGCRYVVVGHSERREFHGETDDIVNRKVHAAIRNGITPILCVGEGLAVREAGEHTGHCTAQLTRGAGRRSPAEQAARPRRGLRAGLGHRHRAGREPGRRAGGVRRAARRARVAVRRRARRGPCASSTAAR